MAETMHDLLRALHISTGFVGLAAFWIPAFARKGGRLHVVAGRVFAGCAYVVALTALGSTAWVLLHPASWAGQPVSLRQIPADQIRFVAILGFLGLLLLDGVEQGVRAMRTRHQPDRFVGWRRRFLCHAMGAAGLALAVFGLYHLLRSGGGLFWIPVALGGASFAGYFDDRRSLANPRPTPMAWWYTHMGGMIGSGIAFHTAFLVFGGQRLWGGALMQGGCGRSCRGYCRPCSGSRPCTSGRATTSGSSESCRNGPPSAHRRARRGRARGWDGAAVSDGREAANGTGASARAAGQGGGLGRP